MASAVARRDQRAIEQLARSVLALKRDLRFLAVTDKAGRGIVEFERSGSTLHRVAGRAWAGQVIVDRARAETTTRKHGGYARAAQTPLLAVAAPICAGSPCSSLGVAIVGEPLGEVVRAAQRTAPAPESSIALYDDAGNLLAEGGPIDPEMRVSRSVEGTPIVHLRTVDTEQIATIYAPLTVQGRRIGRLAVSIPSAPAFASAREAALRLGLLLIAAMLGVVAIGAAISRLILAQVRPLVEANRAFASGDLTARVPVLTEDELGELAHGVNKMAEELQGSYATLEARVAERTEQVLQLLQERTDFFAAISHELRTPLAVIIAQAEMMRDPTVRRTPEWTAETGTAIGDSATQLLSLVNDILDLARAEAGRLVVRVSDLDLAEVIRSVRPAVEGLARAGDIDVAFDVPSWLPVRGDSVRMRQILLNLVDNAVKYTPPRGRICVEAKRRTGAMVEVAVEDTGIGIPPEIGDRIFEPFFRVPDAEPQHGEASTGLGLALARRLVEAQGGTISYTSAVAGTRFVFAFPLAGANSRASATRRPRSSAR
jgi:signal transduction histidine kinase